MEDQSVDSSELSNGRRFAYVYVRMTAQLDFQAIHPDVAASLTRAYLTSLDLLGDAAQAEKLVIEAVHSLDDEITCNTIRDAVVSRLVEAQLRRGQVRASRGS